MQSQGPTRHNRKGRAEFDRLKNRASGHKIGHACPVQQYPKVGANRDTTPRVPKIA